MFDSWYGSILYSDYGIIRLRDGYMYSPRSSYIYYHTYTRIIYLRGSTLTVNIYYMSRLRWETGQRQSKIQK